MNDFWNDIKLSKDSLQLAYEKLFTTIASGKFTKEHAAEFLRITFKRSHLDIYNHYLLNNTDCANFFPSRQYRKDHLVNAKNLWWTDHATAGINGWGTIDWFSSKLRKHSVCYKTHQEALAVVNKRKNAVLTEEEPGKYVVNWEGLSEASTHFVIFTDGTIFYLINIKDGSWHEPRRNADSISVEMVNPLVCNLAYDRWHFWAGPIPYNMLKIQKPVKLTTPFRKASFMMPYTVEQVLANIVIKRACISVTGRLNPRRMSQHTDWNPRKFDMGPLWPFEFCNVLAYSSQQVTPNFLVKTLDPKFSTYQFTA